MLAKFSPPSPEMFTKQYLMPVHYCTNGVWVYGNGVEMRLMKEAHEKERMSLSCSSTISIFACWRPSKPVHPRFKSSKLRANTLGLANFGFASNATKMTLRTSSFRPCTAMPEDVARLPADRWGGCIWMHTVSEYRQASNEIQMGSKSRMAVEI